LHGVEQGLAHRRHIVHAIEGFQNGEIHIPHSGVAGGMGSGGVDGVLAHNLPMV